MSDATNSLQSDFESIEYARWRAEAERSLKGGDFEKRLVSRTLDGIEVQPYYGPGATEPADDAAGFPGVTPFARGSRPLPSEEGWVNLQEFAHPELRESNRQLLRDLECGVSGVGLVPDAGFHTGTDAAVEYGIPLRTLADAQLLFEGIYLDMVEVQPSAGELGGLPLLGLLVAAQDAAGRERAALAGSAGLDPIAQLVREGTLPMSWERSVELGAELVRWTRAHTPKLRPLLVSGRLWHERGSTEVQEVAWAIANGVEWLRGLMAQGVSVDDAARSIRFSFAAGRDVFLEIAKLRAARQLWSRVVQACGGSDEAQAMDLHVRASTATLTQRDPWVNLLRVTGQCFAAALGGAHSITTSAFDEALTLPQEFSRRIARNTQTILREESHLAKVQDPAGGSYFLETMTREYAERAWAELQAIEKAGGLLTWLQAGGARDALAPVQQQRAKLIANRKLPLTGVSEYPNLDEKPIAVVQVTPVTPSAGQGEAHHTREALAALKSGQQDVLIPALIADLAAGVSSSTVLRALTEGEAILTAPALPALRYAEAWERLRDASDAAAERPRVFLANLGTIPQHLARATFAQNAFQAAGIEAITNTGFASPEEAAEAFAASGAPLVCICSNDALYEEHAATLARLLKERGAREVYLAGRSAEHEAAWREAGVDTFLFAGSDALSVLSATLQRLGAL